MNEFTLAEEIKQVLEEQCNYFKETLSNPRELMMSVCNLKSKYNKPYLIHLTRQLERTYESDETELIKLIEESLTQFIQSLTNNGYKVKFKNSRSLTFSILKDDIDICRFSLMNRNFSLMRSLISEEQYHVEVSKTEDLMELSKKNKEEEMDNVEKYKRYEENYWLLLKEIKSLKDLFRFMLNSKSIKDGIVNFRVKAEGSVKYYESELERYKNKLEYLKEKKEFSKQPLQDILYFFNNVGYEADDEHKFYF